MENPEPDQGHDQLGIEATLAHQHLQHVMMLLESAERGTRKYQDGPWRSSSSTGFAEKKRLSKSKWTKPRIAVRFSAQTQPLVIHQDLPSKEQLDPENRHVFGGKSSQTPNSWQILGSFAPRFPGFCTFPVRIYQTVSIPVGVHPKFSPT